MIGVILAVGNNDMIHEIDTHEFTCLLDGFCQFVVCPTWAYATRSQIFDHIGAAVEGLYLKEGALGLNVELNYEIPLENMAAVLDAVEKYRHYKG